MQLVFLKPILFVIKVTQSLSSLNLFLKQILLPSLLSIMYIFLFGLYNSFTLNVMYGDVSFDSFF